MGTVHAMNTSKTERVAKSYQIPEKAFERPKWFQANFGPLTAHHIAFLGRVCGHLPKGQAITFSDIVDDTIHIHYGRYSIYFPISEIPEKIGDWMNSYELEIDGIAIPMSSGLEVVQSSVRENVEKVTTGKKIVDTLLPPKQVEVDKPFITSQHKVIKHSIRLRKK